MPDMSDKSHVLKLGDGTELEVPHGHPRFTFLQGEWCWITARQGACSARALSRQGQGSSIWILQTPERRQREWQDCCAVAACYWRGEVARVLREDEGVSRGAVDSGCNTGTAMVVAGLVLKCEAWENELAKDAQPVVPSDVLRFEDGTVLRIPQHERFVLEHWLWLWVDGTGHKMSPSYYRGCAPLEWQACCAVASWAWREAANKKAISDLDSTQENNYARAWDDELLRQRTDVATAASEARA
jgi:hypothetical protein